MESLMNKALELAQHMAAQLEAEARVTITSVVVTAIETTAEPDYNISITWVEE